MAPGIVLLILGVLFISKPSWIWLVTESWKSEYAAEPSDLYLLSIRIGGTILSIIGAVSIIVSFF
ncbi:hypothetical protein A8F94_22395 [Bacillus sp. FJAT-27225]|uniref:DUF6199 family natural product biosynthesis protein n=1 Tax=Bacillus sp. FJAT-27225 TaxID=1743144 RepID=UPI00080C2FD1|nr:DUF6199 family natural product biosynthesis protein [Bacillus sp. FJAT-27225]OCA81620.1 hypothetical protein A8F94_22395 [Bacillus sp. FJAT-27225]